MTPTVEQMEKWKATLDWYKQLMTVNGAAGVAVAAFLTFSGRTGATIKQPTIVIAYVAILIFLISVGLSVRTMFRVINYEGPEEVGGFLENLPDYLSPFYYFVGGLISFMCAVAWHFFTSAL
jgi:hypothetical protein